MSNLSIDQAYLAKLADSPGYSWMGSLRPLRVWRVAHGGGRRCCGQPKPQIPNDVYRQLAADGQFERDLRELKTRLRLTKLVVNIGGFRRAL